MRAKIVNGPVKSLEPREKPHEVTESEGALRVIRNTASQYVRRWIMKTLRLAKHHLYFATRSVSA